MKFTNASIAALSLALATTALADYGDKYYSDYDPKYYSDYDPKYSDGYDPKYSDGYDGYGYGKPYKSKGKGKGKNGNGGKTNGKNGNGGKTNGKNGKTNGGKNGSGKGSGKDDEHAKDPSDCAPIYCDTLFAKANGYEYSDYGYGKDYEYGYGYDKFTREDCAWTPCPKYGKYGKYDDYGQCKYLTAEQKYACQCYWDYEIQCDTHLMPKYVDQYETEKALACDVAYAIDDYDKYYLDGCLFGDCFSPEIYQCLCKYDCVPDGHKD